MKPTDQTYIQRPWRPTDEEQPPPPSGGGGEDEQPQPPDGIGQPDGRSPQEDWMKQGGKNPAGIASPEDLADAARARKTEMEQRRKNEQSHRDWNREQAEAAAATKVKLDKFKKFNKYLKLFDPVKNERINIERTVNPLANAKRFEAHRKAVKARAKKEFGEQEKPELVDGILDLINRAEKGWDNYNYGWDNYNYVEEMMRDGYTVQQIIDDYLDSQGEGAMFANMINPNRVDPAFHADSGMSIRKLSNAFAIIASKVADDNTGWPIIGDDEWDIPAIMRRKYDKTPLSHCKQNREKQRLLCVLDTSPSCYPMVEFFGSIARAAANFGDVEIFEAPNGRLEFRLAPEGLFQISEDRTRDWGFKNRSIVFFGDWDGMSDIIHNSQGNKLFWFDCEKKIRRNWEAEAMQKFLDTQVSRYGYNYTRHFKGKRYLCNGPHDFIRLAKKIK